MQSTPAGPDTAQSHHPDKAGGLAVGFSGVRFAWPGRRSFTIDIASFGLKRDERLLLLGPSGSGKSTFLALLAGIVTPDSGSITILGTDTTRLSASARDRFRARHFGIIFQMFNLLPYGTVLDNVLLPLSFSSERLARAGGRAGARQKAIALLTGLGLEPVLFDRGQAAELSVGQQQRVAAARALIGSPEIIVADEPTSALDRNAQRAFLDLLFAQAADAGSCLVMVSHDETLADRFDRVVRLTDIAVIERGAAP
jgi:putative ABC transport system ATP-binding protein